MNQLSCLGRREICPWAWTASTLLCLLLLAGVSRADDQVPFKATFHGFAILPPTPTADPDVFEIVVPLTGRATHLGRLDMLLTHFFDLATLAFTGFAEFTAANGDKFYTEVFGQAYLTDDPEWITFDVTHTIVGGTGRFMGATGSFDGVDGRYNLVTGEDLGGYVGTISSPGANKK